MTPLDEARTVFVLRRPGYPVSMDAENPKPDAVAHDRGDFSPVDAGAVPASSTVDYPVTGAPSDNTTLVGVLRAFEEQGFTEQLIAEDGGMVTCGSCNQPMPATELVVEASRRLEGASDPDDMMTVIAARCPRCGVAGTLVLGYGPNASENDVAIYRSFGDVSDQRSETGTVDGQDLPVDPDAPGSSLFLEGDAVEPNEPA